MYRLSDRNDSAYEGHPHSPKSDSPKARQWSPTISGTESTKSLSSLSHKPQARLRASMDAIPSRDATPDNEEDAKLIERSITLMEKINITDQRNADDVNVSNVSDVSLPSGDIEDALKELDFTVTRSNSLPVGGGVGRPMTKYPLLRRGSSGAVENHIRLSYVVPLPEVTFEVRLVPLTSAS
eukprot:1189847-Pyramimonas_sp.AAC.1